MTSLEKIEENSRTCESQLQASNEIEQVATVGLGVGVVYPLRGVAGRETFALL